MFSKLRVIISVIIFLTVISVSSLLAGTLLNSNTPAPTMYTLEDIYNLIHNNATSTHTLSPSLAPQKSMHSVSDIYVDLANLIEASKVASSTTYLGVTGGSSTPAAVSSVSLSFTPVTTPGTAVGYTLGDVYSLINSNTRITAPNHTFTPGGTPASSLNDLDTIYTNLANLIDPIKVATGTRYLGKVGSYVPPDIGPYAVIFSVIGSGGSISATVGGSGINSGDQVVKGGNITFTASPDSSRFVKEWRVDGTVQSGQTDKVFILSNLQTTAEVTVEFDNFSSYLLLNMPFEINSSSTATDISGNGNDGVVYGPVWSDSSGHNGTGAYLFNGNNYIDLGNKGSLQNLAQMTVEAWVKPSSLPSFEYGGRILCNNPWSWGSPKWCFYLYSGNTIHWSFPWVEGIFDNGSNFTVGNWYHMVGTYDGATIKVYVNGVLGSSLGVMSGSVSSPSYTIRIGGQSEGFNGYIDNVKIYNKSFSTEQINDLYNL